MYPIYGTFVVFQHGIRDELFLAHPAFVRPLPRVVPHVNREGCPLGKALGADLARIRFFFGMNSHVNAQQRLGGEALFAELTTERSLPSMRPSVIGQRGLGGQTLPADVAYVHLFLILVLDVHVCSERRAFYELPRADLALQFRLAEVGIVGLHVLFEAGIVPVRFVAELTRELDGFSFVYHLKVFVGGALRTEYLFALPATVIVPLQVNAVNVPPQGIFVLQSPPAKVAVTGILLEVLQSLVVVHHVEQSEFFAADVASEHFFVVHVGLVFV